MPFSAGLHRVQVLDFQARDQMEPFDFRMEGFLPGCPAAGWFPLPTQDWGPAIQSQRGGAPRPRLFGVLREG